MRRQHVRPGAATAAFSPQRLFVASPEALWRDSRLPDPDDTLDALWGADTEVIDLTGGPGTGVRHHDRGAVRRDRRASRSHAPGHPDATSTGGLPAAGSPLSRAVRSLLGGIGRAVGYLVALGLGWLVLVTLRADQAVVARDRIAAELDAAVAETLTTDHVLSVATWVGYVTSTVLVGGLVVERLVVRRPLRLRWGAAVIAGLAAAAAAVPLRAAEVSGQGLAAVTDPDIARLVATSSFGGALALRAAGLLLLAATLGGRAGSGRGRGLARFAGGATVVASYLVIGHAQATDPAVLQVGALAVHLVAVTTWFGGVVVLATELRPRPTGRDHRLPGRAVARFSRTAEAMVVVTLVSGAVLAEGQGALETAPWRTGYGQALIAKLCFVAVVLVIGAYNKLRVVPAVARRDSAAARRHLRVTCVTEALVISLGVLLMTAAMTSGGF